MGVLPHDALCDYWLTVAPEPASRSRLRLVGLLNPACFKYCPPRLLCGFGHKIYRSFSILLCMSVGEIGLMALLILVLVVLLPIWPWGRMANATDWRPLYELVIRDQNSDVLGFHIYNAERAVQLRQKEIRKQPPDSSERLELTRAETTLIKRKAEKVRLGLF
jgi:hypothetical protein